MSSTMGTYGRMRDDVLRLINRYSIAGKKYATTYNNQQDYINRIPALVNDALIYIAGSARKISAQHILTPCEGEVYGSWLKFILPEDCLEVRPGGLLRLKAQPGEKQVMEVYKLQEPDFILLPGDLKEPVVLEYYRRPQLLPDEPEDGHRIDATLDVQMAIEYYVAAHVVMYDDSFAYASLYNEFENKMDRLVRPPTTEITRVHDAYGTENWGDMFG